VRQSYNAWPFSGSPVAFPVTIQVTSTFGEVVTCNYHYLNETVINCNAQFTNISQVTESCCTPIDHITNVYSDSVWTYPSTPYTAFGWGSTCGSSTGQCAFFSGTHSFTYTTNPHTGTNCIQMQMTSYDEFHFGQNSAGRVKQYSSLQFWIRGDVTDSAINMIFWISSTKEGKQMSPVNIPIITPTWQLVTIDMTNLNFSYFDNIAWQNKATSGTYYLDDIVFIPSGTAPSLATCAVTTVNTGTAAVPSAFAPFSSTSPTHSSITTPTLFVSALLLVIFAHFNR